MPSVESQLNRLILNAEEIKALTGWPYEMIEDYLNILSDLILLAESIDIGDENVAKINQQISDLNATDARLRSSINQNKKAIDAISQDSSSLLARLQSLRSKVFDNSRDIDGMRQLIVSW